MMKIKTTTIALITVAFLTSCGKQQGQRQIDTTPSLKIECRQEFPFASGTKAMIWELRGQKVKGLTARLLVCTDGRADTNNEIICRWDDTSKPMHGYLGLLVQDGQLFGMQGKHLPLLSLSFPSGAPNVKSEKCISTLMPGSLGFESSAARGEGSIAGKDVLYAEASKPLVKSHDSSPPKIIYLPAQKGLPQCESGVPAERKEVQSICLGTEDQIVESSKDGGVALGVIVEWKE